MAVSFINSLVNDDALDREIVKKELSALWSLKQQRPHLFYGLPHRIDARSSKDAIARDKLKSFTGPDDATILYVERERKGWENDPRSFWFPPAINASPNDAGPEARVVGLYMQAWQSDIEGKGVYLPRDIAQDHDPEEIFQQMLDCGSRYNNLGKHLGRGIVFALGTELPESYWTKQLPKTETNLLFKAFLNNAKQHKVTNLAERYHSLCQTLLKWFLEHLESLESCLAGSGEDASESLDHTNFLHDWSFPAEFFDFEAYETHEGAAAAEAAAALDNDVVLCWDQFLVD